MMRNLLIFFLVTFGLYAKGLSLPEHFTATFTQQITNPKKKVIQYKGKVYFSNKTLLKWIYTSPTKKEVCSDGHKLTVVDHDLEQVSIYTIDKAFQLERVLKQAKKYKKNIFLAHYENKNYTIQVDAKKRLHSIAYYDELDNKVQILFKNIDYSKGHLGKQIMQCKIPKAYDRIEG